MTWQLYIGSADYLPDYIEAHFHIFTVWCISIVNSLSSPRAVITAGPNAGRLTDIREGNREENTLQFNDLIYKDLCCNREGADCSLYTSKRPLIPAEPPPPPPPPPPPTNRPVRPVRPWGRPRIRWGWISIVPIFFFGKLVVSLNYILQGSKNKLKS